MAYCYFNGGMVDEEEVSLSIHNFGVHRGFGVFDFFRMRDGKYSFIQDHLDRFEKSQRFMDLSHIIEQDEIREAVDTLRDWNGYTDAGFKLMILADGKDSDAELSPLFFILQSDLSNHESAPYASVILHEYVREYPQIKTISYFTSNMLHRKKAKAGAIDVIYHKDDLISEASRSNVFIVQDGVFKTPAENILEGITRKQVLEVASQVGSIEVANVTIDDFFTADEIFICSTLKEICPIVEVDGNSVGSGKVGPLSRKISQLFQQKLMD